MQAKRPILAAALLLAIASTGPLAGAKPPAKPAEIKFTVSPQSAAPGEPVTVHLELRPIEGVKLNRYPKVKLQVPAQEGLVAAAEAAVGNNAPPPADKMNTNYFEQFEGLDIELTLDGAATAGRHEIDGKLVYFYCMPASGFCAPHRTAVKIPLSVR